MNGKYYIKEDKGLATGVLKELKRRMRGWQVAFVALLVVFIATVSVLLKREKE